MSGGDGDDIIRAGAFSAVAGGQGNDTIRVGAKSTIRFDRGDGVDTIEGQSGPTANAALLPEGKATDALNSARIEFGTGIAADDLVVTRNGSDLRIAVAGSEDALVIRNVDTRGVPSSTFADGSSLAGADVVARAIALPLEGDCRLTRERRKSVARIKLCVIARRDWIGRPAQPICVRGPLQSILRMGRLMIDRLVSRVGCFKAMASAALMLALASCASINSQTTQFVGTPKFAAVDPASVQILHVEPTRPHLRLGEVLVDASALTGAHECGIGAEAAHRGGAARRRCGHRGL